MELLRVSANKRCLQIIPSYAKYLELSIIEADINNRQNSRLIQDTFLYDTTGTFYYQLLLYISPSSYNYKLPNYIYNLNFKRDIVNFYYDSDKYLIKSITIQLDFSDIVKIGDYFKEKKIYKILDIFLAYYNHSTNKSTIKIYYLEKV